LQQEEPGINSILKIICAQSISGSDTAFDKYFARSDFTVFEWANFLGFEFPCLEVLLPYFDGF
jgi:hypothetical protein